MPPKKKKLKRRISSLNTLLGNSEELKLKEKSIYGFLKIERLLFNRRKKDSS